MNPRSRMVKIYASVLSLVMTLVLNSSVSGEEIVATSKISEVTLFQDRALIKRTATVNVKPGISRVVFAGIPNSLNAESLKVDGKGSAVVTIQGLELGEVHLSEASSERVRVLEENIRTLESQLIGIRKAKERVVSERNLVTAIKLDAPVAKEGGGSAALMRPRDADEMQKVLQFISNSISRLDAESQKLDLEEHFKKDELDALRRELGSLMPGDRAQSVVEVRVAAQDSGVLELDLSYQVSGAGWRPSYVLTVPEKRAGAEPLTFELESYGVVYQHTGEDWEEVALTLSTGRPHLGLSRPEPEPIFIDVMVPPRPKEGIGAARTSSDYAHPEAVSKSESAPAMLLTNAVEEEIAELSQFGTLNYRIPSPVSLKSDGSKEKLKIGQAIIEGKLTNLAVPYLSDNVYEEAKLLNGQAPLLPGEISIFAGGSFVGNQRLDYVSPGQEFLLPVGLSQNVGVTRAQLKRFEDDSGVVRSFRRITVGYRITAENFTTQPHSLVILERGAVSRNEKIAVKIGTIEPPPLTPSDPQRVSKDENIVEWQLAVGPKEKKVITYDITVEFPADVKVTGLEDL